MKEKDYVKVVYESNPIGEEGIILKLTTFDIEQWKKNQQLEKIPEQQKAIYVGFERSQLNDINFLPKMQSQLNHLIVKQYEKQIMEMKQELEFLRKIKIVPMEYGDSNER